MASILSAILGTSDAKMNDQIIANELMSGVKSSAVAYLGATLESATPEVRRLYSEYLTQCLLSHEALTGLAVKRNWYQPYLAPEQQISAAYQVADQILNSGAH